jgi:hypothetical protein
MQVSSVNSLDAVQKRDHAPISPLALIRLYLARLSLDCRTAQLVDKKRSKTHSRDEYGVLRNRCILEALLLVALRRWGSPW